MQVADGASPNGVYTGADRSTRNRCASRHHDICSFLLLHRVPHTTPHNTSPPKPAGRPFTTHVWPDITCAALFALACRSLSHSPGIDCLMAVDCCFTTPALDSGLLVHISYV